MVGFDAIPRIRFSGHTTWFVFHDFAHSAFPGGRARGLHSAFCILPSSFLCHIPSTGGRAQHQALVAFSYLNLPYLPLAWVEVVLV